MTRRLLMLLVGILLVLDIARWGVFVLVADQPPVSDAAHYLELGESVAHGDIWLRSQRIAYRTPGYPWLLGVLTKGFPEHVVLASQIAQGLLLTSTSILLAWWCRLLTGDRRWALFAWGINLLSVSRATYVSVALSETLFTFMLMVHLVAVTVLVKVWKQKYGRPQLWSASVLAGASLAMLVLVRPIGTYLPLAHLVGIAAWGLGVVWTRNKRPLGEETSAHAPSPFGRRFVLGGEAVFISAMAFYVILLPWLARNQEMFGDSFITEFVGRNIWIVTFQDGAGAHLPIPSSAAAERLVETSRLSRDGEAIRATWQVSNALVKAGMDDAEADRLMKAVALDAIKEHPLRWLESAGRRFINFWRCVASHLPVLEGRWLSGSLWWCQLVAIVTFLAGCGGLICRWTRVWTLWMFALLGYFSSITALVEIPDYRYRLVVEPIMIAFSILGLKGLFTLANKHSSDGTANGNVHVEQL